jgi:hypothetical protein
MIIINNKKKKRDASAEHFFSFFFSRESALHFFNNHFIFTSLYFFGISFFNLFLLVLGSSVPFVFPILLPPSEAKNLEWYESKQESVAK